MARIIDLSQPIEMRMPIYPGDHPALLAQTKTLQGDYYNDHRLEIGMHVGTHVDGPMHLTESTQHILDIPLDQFTGIGCILDVRGNAVIEMKEEYREQIPERSIVLLYTGMDQYYGQERYYTENPEVSAELAQHLIDKQVKILGVDACSPDHPP